jgi:hypothetical protein
MLECLSLISSRFSADMELLARSNDEGNYQQLCDLLSGARHAAAVIRHLSNDQTDRRRLVPMSAVAKIASLIKAATCNPHIGNLCKLKRQSCAAHETALLNAVADMCAQLTAAIRNFSLLETEGRKEVMGCSGLVGDVCSLMRRFKAFPHLQLNCARVLGKLSLLDSFRAQINQKELYVKCLADVVVTEALQCKAIMEGSDGDDISEWPQWQTWPLLSRVCFTLGNLTTTNDSNR